MKRTQIIVCLAISIASSLPATLTHAAGAPISPAPAAAAPKIRLNSIGFLPQRDKKASVAVECKEFAVLKVKDGSKVFSGKATGPALNADTNEQLYTLDFSAVKEPGEYQLEVPEVGKSDAFRVGPDIYDNPFFVAMKGMYLWRCGTAVKAEHNGQTFAHDACHTDDAWMDLVSGEHVKKDGTKGWHDAGDYNKYTINAGVTVGCMFRAWDDFPAIRKMKLNVPESGGRLPDYLAEIKWETDWLLTMQFSDGSVSHKVTTKAFGGFILPELEKTERFFTPWDSAATADFTAMMAMAARYFRPYDPAYADKCLDAAKKSGDFLIKNPQNRTFQGNSVGVSTGGYTTQDTDDRLWAAAEMWETTGDAEALKDLETRIKNKQSQPAFGGRGAARGGAAGQSGQPQRAEIVDLRWDWGTVNNLGLFTYLLSKRPGRDEALVKQVTESAISVADSIVQTRNAHGYARPLGTYYEWGGNGTVARQVLNLQVANRLSPKPEYVEASLDALGYLFGRNSYGRSFVTGLGARSPMNPHDRRCGGDNIVDPWPGYLVGGPNPGATSWEDIQNNYRVNEIAINWNAALIYALAAFVSEGK
jgi:endoglucanase